MLQWKCRQWPGWGGIRGTELMERRVQADYLTEEWPRFFMAEDIPDAKGLACLDLWHQCSLLAFLTLGFGPGGWTWTPLHEC